MRSAAAMATVAAGNASFSESSGVSSAAGSEDGSTSTTASSFSSSSISSSSTASTKKSSSGNSRTRALSNAMIKTGISFFAIMATVFNLTSRRVANYHGAFVQRRMKSNMGGNKNNPRETARVCLMIKHGERYLQEWLDYNLLAIGFTDVHILDNSPEFSLQHFDWDYAQYYRDDRIKFEHFIPNIVHNITDPKKAMKQQQKGYKYCVEQARRDNVTWLATFDVDEFLVLHKHENVLDFMRDSCGTRDNNCGLVSINWFTMGSNNRTNYTDVPVTKRFQYGRKQTSVKSIVDPWAVNLRDKHFKWSHTFRLNKGRTWLDANGNKVKNKGWKLMVHNQGTIDVAALFHYKYLSKEEWQTKNCVRGDVMGKEQELEEICAGKQLVPFAGEVWKDDAWQVLQSRVPFYRQYDNVTEMG